MGRFNVATDSMKLIIMCNKIQVVKNPVFTNMNIFTIIIWRLLKITTQRLSQNCNSSIQLFNYILYSVQYRFIAILYKLKNSYNLSLIEKDFGSCIMYISSIFNL